MGNAEMGGCRRDVGPGYLECADVCSGCMYRLIGICVVEYGDAYREILLMRVCT